MFAVDALKQKEGMTTQEAFDAVWKVFPNAEQHMPPKLQKVVLPAIAIGIMECMAIPACGAFFVALSATILYELGNAGYKLGVSKNIKIHDDLCYKIKEYQSNK